MESEVPFPEEIMGVVKNCIENGHLLENRRMWPKYFSRAFAPRPPIIFLLISFVALPQLKPVTRDRGPAAAHNLIHMNFKIYLRSPLLTDGLALLPGYP